MNWYVRKIEFIIGVQWGHENTNTRAHYSSGKRGLLFNWTVDLRVGIFLFLCNTSDGFFSHVSFGDVLCTIVFNITVDVYKGASYKNAKNDTK